MKKTLMILLSVVLIVAITVAGTLAFLTATSNEVVNTFTVGEINKVKDLKLQEHAVKLNDIGVYEPQSDLVNKATYTVVPGAVLPKDPFVSATVSGSAFLFLEVEDKLPEGIAWTIDGANWESLMDNGAQVKSAAGNPIYFCKSLGRITPQTIGADKTNIITGKTLTVATDFDPATMAQDTTLTFKAYLFQADTFKTPLASWNACAGELGIAAVK